MEKMTIIIIVVVVLCCCSILCGFVYFNMQSNNKNTTNNNTSSTNKKNSETSNKENTSSNIQGRQSSNMQGRQSSNMQGRQSSNMQGGQSSNMQGRQSESNERDFIERPAMMQNNQSVASIQSIQQMFTTQPPANIQTNQQVFTTQPPTTQPPTTQSPNKATFYEHCDYQGQSWQLDVGDYSWVENVGIPNDFLSSVRVPPGLKVILYEHINFQGRQLELTSDIPCLVNKAFNDHTSSIRIINLQSSQSSQSSQVQQKPTFYEHCNYEGRNWNLDVGDYSWVENAGIPNDLISSVKVPPGIQVTLYEHSNFDGRQLILTNDTPCLVGQSFNDHTSSIRVKRI